MIEVRKAQSKSGRWSWCSCCKAQTDTTEIRFSHDGSQGSIVILCNDCIRELMEKMLQAKWFETEEESEVKERRKSKRTQLRR